MIRDLTEAAEPDLDPHELSRAVEAVLTDIGQAVVAMDEGRRDVVVALPAMERSKGWMDAARLSIGAFQDEVDLATDAAQLRRRQIARSSASRPASCFADLRADACDTLTVVSRTRSSATSSACIWRNSGDALFLTDIETNKIVDANPRACAMIGLPSEQIIGREWMNLVAKSSLQQSKDHVAKIGEDAQTPIHGLLLSADGQEIAAKATISAAIAMNGNRLAVSSFRPLSARDEALQEAAFRKAIEQTLPSGLAAVSDVGVQTYVNDRFCDMVGWSRKTSSRANGRRSRTGRPRRPSTSKRCSGTPPPAALDPEAPSSR